jgi:DNA-binding winged helix-turn-helix (wHTH) protein
VIYRFGRFTVDGDTRQVLDGDRIAHLSPKAFDLLLTLIERRSRALSKAELQERLWPETFVGDANLATLVAEVRRVLKDPAHQQAYLRTLHRFGYRFVGEITEGSPAERDAARDVHMYVTTADHDFPLVEGETVIGRAQDAAIRIESAGVSRHHARIVVSGDRASVEDLGSKNGTYLNGERVTRACPLHDGHEIRLGPVTLTFRIAPPTQPTLTMG